jgi:Zn-dependent M28 family amino/carboxypeptidase
MRSLRRLAWPLALLGAAAACGSAGSRTSTTSAPEVRAAAESITADDLLAHIQVLASDEFEGRAPGTRGEELTVNYLIEQFRRLGLKPGNLAGAPGGTAAGASGAPAEPGALASYVQEVPLVGITTTPTASFVVGGKPFPLSYPNDYVAVSRRVAPEVRVDRSEVVFVGYGVIAPEYGWDDYKGVDVRGKTIIMLINDPAVPDPNDPSRLDENHFRGQAMTYYGRWTYKYEIASELGAAAAIIVHETGPAGYPYEVVIGSWGSENFEIQRPDGNRDRVAIEAWITLDKARELFRAAGLDFDQLKEAAKRKDFRPVPLNATASFRARNAIREVRSRNVVALLEGSDPELRDQYVVYTAHWDHLGRDDRLPGDPIYNGALDNASGTAALLELAEAFTRLPTAPARSILFLALTAEEKGLLGARYYAENPIYPLERTLANINIDGLNPWGRTEDIVVIGYGNSTLDELLEEEAAAQGRIVAPDPEPEKGFFYRSDHFEFAKMGVPALYTDDGTRFIGKAPDFGQARRNEYTSNDYHKPSDQVKPEWDLSGAVEDVRLLFQVGYRVANGERWPEWKPGTEFRARREAMLQQAAR